MQTMKEERISSGIALGTDTELTRACNAYNKRSKKKRSEPKGSWVYVRLPIDTVLALSRLHHYSTNPQFGIKIVLEV